MSKPNNPLSDTMSLVHIKVEDHCVINLTRPNPSNKENPIQRQYLAMPGESFHIAVSPLSPVTIGVLPFDKIPDSLKAV